MAAAAAQPSVGGLPPGFSQRSFADVLSQSQLPLAVSSTESHQSVPQAVTHAAPSDLSKLGTHKGFPAIFITNSRWSSLAKSFQWSLVGKFSQGYNKQHPELGRPPVEKLQRYFGSLDLKGEFSIGLLDNRHLLIQLCLEEDFLRLYSQMVWYIGKITMRIFKWTPDFHIHKESSLVPIWVTLPRLPIHLFDKPMLFQIGSLFGLPLRLDAATVSLKRPSVARLQVEIDLLHPRPDQLWIGIGEKGGFWQKVEYENVPSYCQHCWHVGHDEQSCRVNHPELKADQTNSTANRKDKQPQKQIYVPRDQVVISKEKENNAPLDKGKQPVSLDVNVTDGSSVNRATNPSLHKVGTSTVVVVPPGPPTDLQIADTTGPVLESVFDDTIKILVPTEEQQLTSTQQEQLEKSPAYNHLAVGAVTRVQSGQEIRCTPKTTDPTNLQQQQIIPIGRESMVLPIQHTEDAQAAHNSVGNFLLDDMNNPLVVQEIGFSPRPVYIASANSDEEVDAHIIVDAPAADSIFNVHDGAKNCKAPICQNDPTPSKSALFTESQQHGLMATSSQNVFTSPSSTNSASMTTLPLAEIPASPINKGPEVECGQKAVTNLNPYAQSFQFSTPMEAYPRMTTSHTLGGEQSFVENATRYNDSDHFESDKLEDDSSTYDLTDGSEVTIRQKRRDQRKLKAQATTQLVSKEDFEEQSRSFGKKLKKRGRPPGSRNRTFFDVIRTIDTRKSKSTSN